MQVNNIKAMSKIRRCYEINMLNFPGKRTRNL